MSPIKITNLRKLTGHKSGIYALEQGEEIHEFFSADGAGMIVQWDLTNTNRAKLIARVPHNVFALKYNREQKFLYVGTHQGMFYVIDCVNNQLIDNGMKFPKAIFGFLEEKNHLLALGGDGALYFMDKNNHQPQKCLQIGTESLRSIAYNSKHQVYFIGSSDNHIYMVAKDFKSFQKLSCHQNSIFSISTNEDILLAGSRDAHLSVWRNEKGVWELSNYLPAHNFTINKIVQHTKLGLFVTASRDKSIKIWSENPIELLKVTDRSKMEAHAHSVNTLLWTNYHNYLLSGGDDKSIYLWKIE